MASISHAALALSSLKPNEKAVLKDIQADPATLSRWQDLGLVPGTTITFLRRALSGDPIQIKVGEALYGIRIADAEKFRVQKI